MAKTLLHIRAILILVVLPLCWGCPATERLPSGAPVRELTDERTQRAYLLYVPSTYSEKNSYSLVVACHGTWPYDTPDLQMREWAAFAENRGIIVVAPQLTATKGDFPPPPEQQVALQNEDEKALLAIVNSVKRQYRIAEERVFMTGWSAGAYSMLHTGLRNPDVFRAFAIRQGSFDARFMEVPKDRLDRWQRILVIYGTADFLRDQSKAMIQWLRDEGMYVDQEEIPGSHRRIDPKLAWRYFCNIVKEAPWVRVRSYAADAADPRVVRFCLDAVPAAVKTRWYFGDGDESTELSPVHTYQDGGRYEVRLEVQLKDGKKYARKHILRVNPL